MMCGLVLYDKMSVKQSFQMNLYTVKFAELIF